MANITDGIITLRALEPDDVDLLYRWENDPELWQHGDRRAPLSLAGLQEYVLTYDADPFRAGQLRLMIVLCDDEKPSTTIGAIDLYDVDVANLRAAVGILIADEHRGNGFACRAVNLLCEYVRKCLGLHQLWCVVGENNAPSRAMFTKAGFSISGHLRSWLRSGNRYDDAYIYQKLLV